MKTQSVLVALTSVFLFGGDVSAKCYGSGNNWPNKEQAQRFILDACKNKNGMFTGTYTRSQTKAMCPHNGGIGLLFEVQNLNPNSGTVDLDDNDCFLNLQKEILGCDKGGESTTNGWRYRADPGNC